MVFPPDSTETQFHYLGESKYDITDMRANPELHWLGGLLLHVLCQHYFSAGRPSAGEAMNGRSGSKPSNRRPANGRNRRILFVAVHSGEGRLTEHITATQAQPPELVFMPLSGRRVPAGIATASVCQVVKTAPRVGSLDRQRPTAAAYERPLRKASAADPRIYYVQVTLAAALGLRGDVGEGKAAPAEFLKLKPQLNSLAKVRAHSNPRYPALAEKTFDLGLRRAGLPEK
jgi:hypothetical protein